MRADVLLIHCMMRVSYYSQPAKDIIRKANYRSIYFKNIHLKILNRNINEFNSAAYKKNVYDSQVDPISYMQGWLNM